MVRIRYCPIQIRELYSSLIFLYFNTIEGNGMNNKDQYFMEHALVTAKASKCTYFQVGAVIVKNDRIISHGYNGTPSGFPEECSDNFCGDPSDREAHHVFSENNIIHAEMNALLWAAREGISIEGSIIYVTLQPCHNCTKSCVAAGIKKIIYKDSYDKSNPYSQEFCVKAGVELIKLDSLLEE